MALSPEASGSLPGTLGLPSGRKCRRKQRHNPRVPSRISPLSLLILLLSPEDRSVPLARCWIRSVFRWCWGNMDKVTSTSSCLHTYTNISVELFERIHALLGSRDILLAVFFDVLLKHSSPKSPCKLQVLLSSAEMNMDYSLASELQEPCRVGANLLDRCEVERQDENVFWFEHKPIHWQGPSLKNPFKELRRN